RSDLEDIVRACHTMSATVSGLLELARVHATSRPETSSVEQVLAAATAHLDGDTGVVVDIAAEAAAGSTDEKMLFALPRDLAVRALSPVLANAMRHARSHVAMRARSEGGQVFVEITDDGPGVDDGEVIFRPGHSGSGGSGLGLPLARRIARTVGGDVVLLPPGDGAGARFEVRLPGARTPPDSTGRAGV
ncbi:MAG: ATP-binding protein, partial [Brachybacterium sp.]|nr:ATP-binding protein [Brachybacterium sp.]